MQQRPRVSPSLRNSSSTGYFPRPSPSSFRTLLKRRNDTIASSQLFDPQPVPPSKNITKQAQSPSSVRSQSQKSLLPVPSAPAVGIKDFVKTIGTITRLHPQQKQTQNSRITYQDEEREGQRSARSTRSAVSNCSRSLIRKDPTEAVLVKIKVAPTLVQGQPKTLSEVQRRVQALISQAIALFKKGRGRGRGVARMAGADLRQLREKEVWQLIGWYREHGSALSAQGKEGEERLQDLSRKIMLIEKMMAQGTVQGELMQEAYFGWKNQRGNTTSFTKSSILKDSAKYNTPSSSSILLNQQPPNTTTKKQPLVGRYDSTSKAAFTRPPPHSYLTPHPKRSSYSANRQPLPRSSYASQFLNYGQLPSYSHKPSSLLLHPETNSLAVTASTYQQEYKEKLAQTATVSFTDLDCYRNKIQRTDISFMNASRKDQKVAVTKGSNRKMNGPPAASKENLCAKSIKRSQEESLLASMNMSTSCMFKSEHQKEFFWRNTFQTEEGGGEVQGGLKAEIKDRRLEKLKESFRALAKRR